MRLVDPSLIEVNRALADATWHKPVGAGAVNARLFFDQQQVDRFFQLTPADASYSLGGVSSSSGLQSDTAFTTRTAGGEVSGEIALLFSRAT